MSQDHKPREGGDLIEALLSELESSAQLGWPVGFDEEDFCPGDQFGGNFDDAYNGGITDGEILYARKLLGQFFTKKS